MSPRKRETSREKAHRLREVLNRLEDHPALRNAPVFGLKKAKRTPFQALVATLLSSRTRDETTLPVVERLFRKIRTPEDVLRYDEATLARMIYPVGFYRTKARHLRQMADLLLREYGGRVPDRLEDLLRLPGVGRKTANIVLNEAFGRDTIGVDVHVHRIAHRLGLVKTRTPEQTEVALTRLLRDPSDRRRVNVLLVALGQTLCTPRNPRCEQCPLADLCPYPVRSS